MKLQEVFEQSIEQRLIKEEDIIDISKKSIQDYLSKVFDKNYSNWRFDLFQTSAKTFVSSTNEIHNNFQLVIDCIHAYRNNNNWGNTDIEIIGEWDIRDLMKDEGLIRESDNVDSNVVLQKDEPKPQMEYKHPILNPNATTPSYKKFCGMNYEEQLQVVKTIEDIPESDRDMNQRYIMQNKKYVMRSK